jgi:hypothetical protein
MATVLPPQANFEMGRVFGRTFEVIGRNLALYLAIAVVLVGLPTLLFQLAIPEMQNPNAMRDAVLTGATALSHWLGLIALAGLVGTLFRYLLQAALVRATIEDLSDRRPNFADCLNTGLRVVLPIIGLGIVSAVAVFFACLLLIVPGIMLAIAWSVAVPAKVAEGIGVFDSLSRSRALTKGHRWKIFWLLLLTAMLMGFIQGVFVAALAAFGPTVGAFASAVVSAIAAAVMATLVATMYVELRTLKEGTDVDTLASVFS